MNVHLILYSPNLILYSPNLILYSPNLILYSTNLILYSTNVILYSTNLILYSPNFILHSPNLILYSPHLILYSPDCLKSVRGRVFSNIFGKLKHFAKSLLAVYFTYLQNDLPPHSAHLKTSNGPIHNPHPISSFSDLTGTGVSL